MKYAKYFLASVAILAVSSLLYTVMWERVDSKKTLVQAAESYASEINSDGPVEIEVTPVEISPSKEWKFRVALDTHTTPITEDIVKSSKLIDGEGKEYQAVSWDGDEAGGHHRKGVLTFQPVRPMPQTIVLRIENVGGVQTREFSWELKK